MVGSKSDLLTQPWHHFLYLHHGNQDLASMKIAPILGIALSILLLSTPACEKYDGHAKGEVELYLLESYENLDQSWGIDASSVEIEKEALILYSEFKSYNSKKHVFRISKSAADKVENLEHSVNGLPFAVIADEELIYTAYFWPSYSSASCDWVVVDPFMLGGENELHVQLGYPGLIEGVQIPDERNNKLILDIFRRDGKLIE